MAATSISLMTSTTMVVFEFFQKKRSCSKRRPRIRAWLLGSWEQCSLEEEEASRFSNQKFLDAPKVMAEVCDYRGCFGFLLCFGRDGAWESINSVHQTAPGRSSVVNISHHHQVSQATIASTRKKEPL